LSLFSLCFDSVFSFDEFVFSLDRVFVRSPDEEEVTSSPTSPESAGASAGCRGFDVPFSFAAADSEAPSDVPALRDSHPASDTSTATAIEPKSRDNRRVNEQVGIQDSRSVGRKRERGTAYDR
jgi:hypothetical protein